MPYKYSCVECGYKTNKGDEMYVLEDHINKKIYVRCEDCEKRAQDEDNYDIEGIEGGSEEESYETGSYESESESEDYESDE